MNLTKTLMWMGLAWLTAAQAVFQISGKSPDNWIPEEVTPIDANMTIGAVSMDWIEVDYELDDVPVIELSILQYAWGSDDGQTLCPPSVFQRSERKMYSCRIEELTPCTEYDLNYFGITTTDNFTVQYTSEIRGVRTTADETIPPSNLTCNVSEPGTLTVDWSGNFPEDCLAAFSVAWEGYSLWDDGLSASNYTTTSDSFYTLTDVIPEADYTLDVSAWFQGDYPGATASIKCTTLAAESSAPQNVSVTPAPYNVTVNWAAPVELNGVIIHYDVLAAWANGSIAANQSTEGPTSKVDLIGLAPCSTIQVTVAAVNGAGPGAASDPVEATTLEDDYVDPYIWLGCYNETQAVSVMWKDVLTNCGPSSYSLGYSARVAWDESKNIPLKNAALEGGLVFQVPEEDYVPGAHYSFELSTGTRNGSCDVMSNDEKSGPPLDVTVNVTTTTLLLSWQPPETPNGVISCYYVEVQPQADRNVSEYVMNDTLSKNVTGLSPCFEYVAVVYAFNRAGPGDGSRPQEVLVPGNETDEEINIDCSASGDSIVITWEELVIDCRASEEYDLNVTVTVPWNDELSSSYSYTESNLSSIITDTDYIAGSQYDIIVAAGGIEGFCLINTADQTSSPPVLTVVDAGTNYLYLTWEPPTAANGVIDSYELLWSVAEGNASKKTIPIGSVNEFNLTEEVFACCAYHLALAAHNGAGVGEWDRKDAETLRADLGGIRCEEETDHSVSVDWAAAPANCDRNGTILSWQGESRWDLYVSDNSTFLEADEYPSTNVTDLYPFTNYNICVTLTEEWAEEACCDATTRQGVPTIPQNIQASSTVSSISLSWEEPESWNGSPSNYSVSYGGGIHPEAVDANTTQLPITDLKEDTNYTISVMACNEEQCSQPSKKNVSTKGRPTEQSNTGLIVGLTLGSVALVLIIAGVVFSIVRTRRRSQLDGQAERKRVVAGTNMGSIAFSLGKILTKVRDYGSTSSASSGITVSKF